MQTMRMSNLTFDCARSSSASTKNFNLHICYDIRIYCTVKCRIIPLREVNTSNPFLKKVQVC